MKRDALRSPASSPRATSAPACPICVPLLPTTASRQHAAWWSPCAKQCADPAVQNKRRRQAVNHRQKLKALLGLAAMPLVGRVAAQEFPIAGKPIRVVVGFPAGGG